MDGKPLTRELKANLAERKVDECGFAVALSRVQPICTQLCPGSRGPSITRGANAPQRSHTPVAISARLCAPLLGPLSQIAIYSRPIDFGSENSCAGGRYPQQPPRTRVFRSLTPTKLKFNLGTNPIIRTQCMGKISLHYLGQKLLNTIQFMIIST